MPQAHHLAVVKTLAPEDPPEPAGATLLAWHDADALLRLADLVDELDDDEALARERLRGFVLGLRLRTACPGCEAPTGVPHSPGCDLARCWWTGGQRVGCGHDHPPAGNPQAGLFDEPWRRCGEDAWAGDLPGAAEARALGLWCCWHPGEAHEPGRWVPCEDHHPDARLDVGRLVAEGTWDRENRRWSGVRDAVRAEHGLVLG